MLNVKDLDKEVVLRLNDRDFVKISFLNKYLYNLYKEDKYLIFKRRLQKYYPDTVKLRFECSTWREHYFLVIKTITRLREICNFEYKFGNPFKQLMILENIGNFKNKSRNINTFYYGIVQNELALVKYAVEIGNQIISKYDILDAASLNDPEILKYLIARGANLSFFNQHYWDRISEECRDFLRTFNKFKEVSINIH